MPRERRDVFSKTNPVRQHNKGQKPTTSKALVLRNGKHGSQGTGELMLLGRMTGREKLDLLAGKRILDCIFRGSRLLTFCPQKTSWKSQKRL